MLHTWLKPSCLFYCITQLAMSRKQEPIHHESHDFADVLQNIKFEYLDPVEDASPLPQNLDPPLMDEVPEGM